MANFQWDPDADQVYNGNVDLNLSGTPENFDKAAGKSFTMNAPSQSLALNITGPGSTRWGSKDATPAHIDVEHGVFNYGTPTPIDDAFLVFTGLQTTLSVKNDAQFSTRPGLGFVMSREVFNIGVQDLGVVDISCLQCALGETPDDYVNINISDAARMAVEATNSIGVINGTIHVMSRPQSGYSFMLAAASDSGVEGQAIELLYTQVSFYVEATGFLKAPMLQLNDTQIRVTDTAILDVRFDACDFTNASQFILEPGDVSAGKTAAIRIDAYTPGKQPFDFEHNTYPEGFLEFTSGTSGAFMIYLPDKAFDARRMLTQGVIAIDGQPQRDYTKLDFIHATGPDNIYTAIRLKRST